MPDRNLTTYHIKILRRETIGKIPKKNLNFKTQLIFIDMEEKSQKQSAIGKFIEDHPIVSFMTLFLFLDFTKDMVEIFVNKNRDQQTK